MNSISTDCLMLFTSIISAIAAIFAAIAAWKSSNSARSILTFQKNIVNRKDEVRLLSDLIEKLVELNTFTKYSPLELSDDKLLSVDSLIEEINSIIVSLKSVGFDMEKQVEEWLLLEHHKETVSLKRTLDIKLDIEILSVINENPEFLQERIGQLKKIQSDILL